MRYWAIGLLGAFLGSECQDYLNQRPTTTGATSAQVDSGVSTCPVQEDINKASIRELLQGDGAGDVFEKLDKAITCPAASTTCDALHEKQGWLKAAIAILGRRADVTPKESTLMFLKKYTPLIYLPHKP